MEDTPESRRSLPDRRKGTSATGAAGVPGTSDGCGENCSENGNGGSELLRGGKTNSNAEGNSASRKNIIEN